MNKHRILIISDSPFIETEFADQSRRLGKFFQSEGHTVAYIALGDPRPDESILSFGNHTFNWHTYICHFPITKFIQTRYNEILNSFSPTLILYNTHIWNAQLFMDVPYRKILCFHIDGKPMPCITNGAESKNLNWPETLLSNDYVVFSDEFSKVTALDRIRKYNAIIPDDDKWVTIYDGVDLNVFHPIKDSIEIKSKKWNIPEGSFVIGYFGNPNNRKYVPYVIESFAEWENRPDNAYLYLHYPLHPEKERQLKTLIEDYGIGGKIITNVKLHSGRGMSDVLLNELYNVCDCVISLSYDEGFGQPALRALATNTPIITTAYAGLYRFLGNGISLEPLTFFYEHGTGIKRVLVNNEKISTAYQRVYYNKKNHYEWPIIKDKEQFNYRTTEKQWESLIDSIPARNLCRIKEDKLVSIIVPMYNSNPELLRKALESVQNQTYGNYEIIVVDDGSTDKKHLPVLNEFEHVKLITLEQNTGIANATTEGIKAAQGEYIGFLDHDDTLKMECIEKTVEYLETWREFDLVYTDEEIVDSNGKLIQHVYKEDYNEDLLLSMMYINHFRLYRADKLKEFMPLQFPGAQDYDLTLRFSEKYKIGHIRKILYTWMASATSSLQGINDVTVENNKSAVKEALKRRGIDAEVKVNLIPTQWKIDRKLKTNELVSIIILTKGKLDLIRNCIMSIEKYTNYPYELIVVDTGSTEPEVLSYLEEVKQRHMVIFDTFHFSRSNNDAVKLAKGSHICLLNNDTIATPGWLAELMKQAQRPEVGIVGPKLLYPNNAIQHCLLPDEQILTNNGEKKIVDVKTNDIVLTHTGKYKSVIRTINRNYDGNMIKIYPYYRLPISFTPEHPILIHNKGWISAKNVTNKDSIMFPINRKELNNEELINIMRDFITNHQLLKGVKDEFDNSLILLPMFWRIIGYWLAKGSLSKTSRGTGHNIRWTFNENEIEYKEEIRDFIKNKLKRSVYIEENKDTHSFCINTTSKILYYFMKQFGTYAYKKNIPTWVEFLPLNLQKELLTGYYRGDGGYVSVEKRQGCGKFASTSIDLLYGIQRIFLRFNVIASVNLKRNEGEMVIQERKYNTRKIYSLIITNKDLNRIFGYAHAIGKKRKQKGKIIDNFLITPIRKIIKEQYIGKVYNLEVEEDNSYCSQLIAIHNCGVALGIGGLAGHMYLNAPKNSFHTMFTMEVSAVTGACLVIRKDLYEKVGGLEERYMIEFQDIDLCLKVKALGYKIIYTPHSLLYHHCSVTRGIPSKTESANDRSLFAKRWYKELDVIDPAIIFPDIDTNNKSQLLMWFKAYDVVHKGVNQWKK